MKKFVLLAAVLISGCATPYQYYGYAGGYSDGNFSKNISVARFTGNGYTKVNDAKNFSKLRAIEICKERGAKVTRIYQTINLTRAETVQKTSFTSNNVGGTQFGQADSWNETTLFPAFDSYFSCENKALFVGAKFRPVTSNDMKVLVKDLIGGVQILSVKDDSPNREFLKAGDIIIKVNDQRIASILELDGEIELAGQVKPIEFSIFRDGNPLKLILTLIDETNEVEHENVMLLQEACSAIPFSKPSICKLNATD